MHASHAQFPSPKVILFSPLLSYRDHRKKTFSLFLFLECQKSKVERRKNDKRSKI